MSNVQITSSGNAVPAGDLVATDGTTITGTGNVRDPLRSLQVPGPYAMASVIDNKGPAIAAGSGFSAVSFDGTYVILVLDTPLEDPLLGIPTATLQPPGGDQTFTISAVMENDGTAVKVRIWSLGGSSNVSTSFFVTLHVLDSVG